MNTRQLDSIYKIYKFEQKNSGFPQVRVYTYTSGYFNNADIVPLIGHTKEMIEAAKNQFEDLGYSVSIRSFSSEDEADVALFKGFFNIQHHKQQLLNDYSEYCKRCSHAIEGDYTYIPSCFHQIDAKGEQKSDVISEIQKIICTKSPQMIVLEAPAGFGKTTTVQELVHSLCKDDYGRIPFITELSRNRQAQIFKYVLLDELDRQFPALKLDLVTHHIQKGNIVLVIDGFDELLTKRETETPDSLLIAAEPMLETISQLLKDNAKIILTTRKTAIFSGDFFHEWIERHSESFTVTRFEICEPSAREWLSDERLKKIKETGLDLESVPNPVLLAWLRARPDDEFHKLVDGTNGDGLIDKYFERLLSREQGRQKLYIKPQSQKEIFTSLAGYFSTNDISSEQKEYLSIFFTEEYGGLLEEIAKTYPPDEKLTLELLVDKLTNHVFLDRKIASSLGFVNDFFFGYFLGESILQSPIQDWEGSSKFIELASASFRCRSEEKRDLLWRKLNTIIDLQSSITKFQADFNLKKSICRGYKFEIFEEAAFANASFGKSFAIESSLFNNCSFTKCEIHINGLDRTNFAKCRFYDCVFIGPFSKAHFPGCYFSPEIEVTDDLDDTGIHEIFDSWEIHVLRKFWPDGQSRMNTRRKISTLKMGTSQSNGEHVENAIQSLRKRGYLHIEDYMAVCEIQKINDIRIALGR